MDKEKRKKQAEFHKKLIDLLTDTESAEEYYERLVWANQIVANEFSRWQEGN